MSEELRPIPGFPDYFITSDGNVWSEKQSGRWLNPTPGKGGYLRLALSRDKKIHSRLIHTLVAQAWIGPRPDGLEVCHDDGDPLNNSASNLRYDTHASNMRDKIRHGTATSHNALKTHCPQGHPYDEINTRQYKSGRICRTCSIERGRQAYRDKVGRPVRRSGGGWPW
jgi:hypothetical protein